MHYMGKLSIVVATICVLALGVFALAVRSPVPQGDPDVIIIKGGSLEIQCGQNHGTDCLGTNDNMGRYRHRKSGAHIMKVVVRPLNSNTASFTGTFDKDHQPQIEITYR